MKRGRESRLQNLMAVKSRFKAAPAVVYSRNVTLNTTRDSIFRVRIVIERAR